jgi:hypothetical protein
MHIPGFTIQALNFETYYLREARSVCSCAVENGVTDTFSDPHLHFFGYVISLFKHHALDNEQKHTQKEQQDH